MRVFKTLFLVCGLSVFAGPASVAHAADPHMPELPKVEWSFSGILGTYDRAALQRGYRVYAQVCAACHGMDRLYYRHLSALGYDEGQITALAGEYVVMDGPSDEGEMFERPARPSDRFVNPYPNRQAAMFANNGAFPPDLSLIVKARYGGADYIHALLTGYEEPPQDADLMDGQYWNRYMPGHIIAMAPPMADGMISYEDDTPETVAQYAKDLSNFLAWAAEPHMEQRKRTGIKVFLFLLVFTGLMYAVKKKIWADVH